MATDLKTMMDRLPAKRRRKVEARAAELIAEEMTLRDLRKARDLTQARLAEMLDIGQDGAPGLSRRVPCVPVNAQPARPMGGSAALVVLNIIS